MVRVSDQSTRAYHLTLMCLEGKETRVVIRQVANAMDRVNYDRIFADGSLRRIRLLTTTLPAVPIANKQRSSFSKEISSPNGNPTGHFCGSTENVRSPDLSTTDGC